MTDLNPNEEANRIAEQTFLPKVKNILRLLDDNGYKDTYTWVHNFDTLTIALTHPTKGLFSFALDLSSPSTDQQTFDYMKIRMGDA